MTVNITREDPVVHPVRSVELMGSSGNYAIRLSRSTQRLRPEVFVNWKPKGQMYDSDNHDNCMFSVGSADLIAFRDGLTEMIESL